MTDIIFTVILAAVFSTVYAAAFKFLPQEKWQVFASIPAYKTGENSWHGVNITYYGILTATAYTIAISVFLLMMSSAGVPVKYISFITVCIIVVFVPSAKLMAFIVEKKKHTITVGGAVFVLIVTAPWLVSGINSMSGALHTVKAAEQVFLASVITAYAFGEGFGRLACISFGCCYGRPVDMLSGPLHKIFSKFNFVYTGKTKKISYHDNMDGVTTVPVQAITVLLYTASGLAGLLLFMRGHFYLSFLLTLSITQLWRFFSEFLRADFRGGGKISAYQVMSLATLPYYAVYVIAAGRPCYEIPSLTSGFTFMWAPAVIIMLGVMWTGALLYTGISSVTSSDITIYVNRDKI